MEFSITGIVREKESKQPIPGLLVRAFDKDLFYADLLGNAITASDGSFSIGYEGKDFQELFDRRPDIYLDIYGSATAREPGRAGDSPIYTTKKHVRFNAGRREHFKIEIPHGRLGVDAPGIGVISTPKPGRWKELIDAYIKEHPVDFRYDAEKGFMVPSVSFASTDWPGPVPVGSSGTRRIALTNKGNAISFSCYVEIYEGPFGFGHRLRDYRLCDYQILTINPGQTVNVELRYNRLMTKGALVAVCFDPFLDPLGFHLVEQIQHGHLTSQHYYTTYENGTSTWYAPHNSPYIPQASD